MATVCSFFNGFCTIFLLFFLSLGCFLFSSDQCSGDPTTQPPRKRRKVSPLSSSLPTSSSSSNILKVRRFISVRSYLADLFSLRRSSKEDQSQPQPLPTPIPSTPPASPPPQPLFFPDNSRSSLFVVEKDTNLTKRSPFASRADIYPCPSCGEVLLKPQLLDLHHAAKHSLSELSGPDSGKNIVEMIFKSGWRGGKSPVVNHILKIHNTAKTLARFEEYRDTVRSRAAVLLQRRGGGEGDERCIADGNERLRFYCSTVLCPLGRDARTSLCGSQFCSTCGIVRHGLVGKHADLEGIPTHATSWGAHVSLPDELEEEFAFLHVRRAMVVCRVVAGRVARGSADDDEKGVYDSVAAARRSGRGLHSSLGGEGEEEELLVFNPWAVLPCFVIFYTV